MTTFLPSCMASSNDAGILAQDLDSLEEAIDDDLIQAEMMSPGSCENKETGVPSDPDPPATSGQAPESAVSSSYISAIILRQVS